MTYALDKTYRHVNKYNIQDVLTKALFFDIYDFEIILDFDLPVVMKWFFLTNYVHKEPVNPWFGTLLIRFWKGVWFT